LYCCSIPNESIVDVEGRVTVAQSEIHGATQSDVEIFIDRLFVVSTAQTPLPIQLEDAERAQPLLDAQEAEIRKIDDELKVVLSSLANATDSEVKADLTKQVEALSEAKGKAQKFVVLSQPLMLDNRILDLRVCAAAAAAAGGAGVTTTTNMTTILGSSTIPLTNRALGV
jgi:aspartyl-tRNA synthetase